MPNRVVPGSGAILEPVFNAEYGVSSITVVDGGSGYASTDPPLIEVRGTKFPIREGVFYPVISGVGTIRRIVVIDPGYGYEPETNFLGTKIGIETTAYVESSLIVRKGTDSAPYLSVASSESSIIMGIAGADGTAIFENGYNSAISTSIVGTSSSITPDFSGNQNRLYGYPSGYPSYSTSGIGTEARFSVFIVYDSSNGIPISTSIILNDGGRNYSVGDTVSISGTFMNGSSPANDLSFVVSSVSNSQILPAANNFYENIPGVTLVGYGTDATFNVLFDGSGFVSNITVNNGGVGYALTDVISIAATHFGGSSPGDDIKLSPSILGTDELPTTLYVDKIDDNTFQVSGLSTSRILDIRRYGNGTQSFEYSDPNSSAIISIDNIIQSPLYFRNLSFELVNAVDLEQEVIYLKSGITSLTSLDTLQLNSEYLKVKTVGVGSTNAVGVIRGAFGSRIGIHTVGIAATVVRGDYNITRDKITFSTPPYGPTGPSGLEINSSFQGRFFSRRFDPNQINDKNLILDDISVNFTGIAATEFVLKSKNQDVVGLFTDTNSILNSTSDINNNPLILINNIPQISRSDFIVDTPGQNTLKFLSGVPKAGKIVRAGITTGFGYIPLIGAGATAIVGIGISLSSYDSISYQITQDTNPTGFFFKPDGTKLFVVGSTNYKIYEYDLSSPYNLTTVSFATSCPTGGESVPTGLFFRDDGTEVYYVGSNGDAVRKASLPTPWSLVGASNTSVVVPASAFTSVYGFSESTPTDLFISPDGTNIYVSGSGLKAVFQFVLDTPWDSSTLNLSSSTYYSVAAIEQNPLGITFTPDGNQMFVVGNNASYQPSIGINTGEDRIYQYKLQEAWNVSSAVFVSPNSYRITQDTSPSAIGFNTSYTKMYVLGQTNDRLYQYTPNLTGTISSIRVIGPGSGYRTPPIISLNSDYGSGAIINSFVGVGGTISGFEIKNVGFGYTGLNPDVIIGIPSSYSDLNLEYINGASGDGQDAKVSVVVGNGSSIIGFKIENPGISYKVGDVLKVPGITTNPNVGAAFSEFRITVQEVFTDKFSGIYPGQFVQFDDISQFFTGRKKKFTLTVTINNQTDVLSLKSPLNSDLQLENNLFVFINDILQEPFTAYTYSGSRITFKEAPKPDSKCNILFYRGSDIDVEQIDPPRTIKEGDAIRIGENILDITDREQFERIVKKIISTDTLDTFTYDSLGINTDPTKLRPLKWTKQTSDRIINGVLYSKSRPDLKSRVYPNARIIKKVGLDDNQIYVDNVFPIFTGIDNISEDLADILIVEDREISPAFSSCVVSPSSTISNIEVISPGTGYQNITSPVVSISSAFIEKRDPIYNWSNTVGVSSTGRFTSILYHENRFIALGNTSILGISTTGIGWTERSIDYSEPVNINSVDIDSSDRYVAVGQSATILFSQYSNSGIGSWYKPLLVKDETPFGSPTQIVSLSTYDGEFNKVLASKSRDIIVAVGDDSAIFSGVGYGTELIFERSAPIIAVNINSIASNNTTFVVVADSGRIAFSDNSISWTRVSSVPTTYNINDIIWNGSTFIAVGDNGIVLQSLNGKSSWERINGDATFNFKKIKYYYGFYTALSDNGDLYFSFDLSVWVQRSTLQNNQIEDMIYIDSLGANGRYVAVGAGSTIIYAEPIYNRASAIGTATDGGVSSIIVLNPGFGYPTNKIPPSIVESDTTKSEKIYSIKTIGDFGTITDIGVGATTIDFKLESENYDNISLGIGYSSLNTYGVFNPQLQVGDYFVIYDSNCTVGHALTGITTSLGGLSNYPESRVGTAVSFIDGVYRVEQVSQPFAGIVTVRCNFALSPTGGAIQVNTALNENGIYGRYTWGKIYDFQNRAREIPQEFDLNTNNGLLGLSTAPFVYRIRGID